jgi:K+-sensing histidine kinase KdpD
MRWLSGLVASVAMVAAVTAFIALIDPHVPPLSFLMLYLLVVLPVAVVWGTVFAVVTSVLSVAVYVYAFEVADVPSAVALAVFLMTAVVVGELAARLRRAALASARLTEEQSALRRVATLVARSVPPPVVFEAVTEEVGRLCDANRPHGALRAGWHGDRHGGLESGT